MEPAYRKVLRRVLPRSLVSMVRYYQVFEGLHGHSARDAKGMAIDGNGTAVPWLTYPAIEFLRLLDLSGLDVFEFGSGSSTLFFASRVNSVKSIEFEPNWFGRVKKTAPENAEIVFCEDLGQYPATIGAGKNTQYDIILVDGAERARCVQKAVEHLKPGGIVILDNTEWYPNSAKYLRDRGFVQIDFQGFSPHNAFTHATSFFYQEPRIISRRKQYRVEPLGFRPLSHDPYDDNNFLPE